MTNEWLDDATARRAAYEWTEAKDEETGLRLMREVLPPLVRVRELRAVEAERNKLRARVAELTHDLVATTNLATQANNQCAHMDGDRQSLLARIRELEARLLPPGQNAGEADYPSFVTADGGRTWTEKSRPAPAPVAADAGLTDDECRQLNAARRAAIVEPIPSGWVDIRAMIAKYLELRPQPARLRMPTVEEAQSLIVRTSASNAHSNVLAFLRTLGADLVESEPSAQVYTYNPTTGVARSMEQVQEQAATGEPEPVETLRDRFAMAAFTGLLAYSYVNPANGNFHENCSVEDAAVSAYQYADAMLAARRRVEGGEARRG